MTDRLATEFAAPEDSPGLSLWRVTNAWQASIRAALKPFGLTHVQFVLLAALSWLGPAAGGITQQGLATYARTDPMMTSQVLRTLEQLGYLRRDPHPTDRRARLLVITDTGRAIADQANGAVEACDRQFFAVLGDDATQLAGLLGRLTGDR